MYQCSKKLVTCKEYRIKNQVIFDPDYLPEYLSVSYQYVFIGQADLSYNYFNNSKCNG